MSSPGAGTESPNFFPSKTVVFSSKPAGGDTAPPLPGVCVIYNRPQIRWCKQFDKPELAIPLLWALQYQRLYHHGEDLAVGDGVGYIQVAVVGEAEAV